MIEEARFALDLNVGEKSGMYSTGANLQTLIVLDGKVMSVVELANDLSLRTFTRALGDKHLCRDQKYIDAFNTWSRGNMVTGFITLMFPFESLRLAVTWPLALYQKHVRQQKLFNIAKSHIIRRLEEERLGTRDDTETDTLKSAIKLMATDPCDPESINSLAAQLWQLTWAGAQSPTMTLANMFVRVLEKPEHGKALYEEARSAVERHGWGDAMLNHMSLMDSFIREVHRLYPILSSTLFPSTQLSFAADRDSEYPEKGHEPTLYFFRQFHAPNRHRLCFPRR
jgi:cytochrome P450